MNYVIKSVNQINRQEVAQNAEYDRQYRENDEVESQSLYGTPFRIEVELVQNDCPIYLSLFAGSVAGVQLEHSDKNYSMLEAYPSSYMPALLSQLELDFPHIIDHNVYEEHAELAVKYLQGFGKVAIQNKATVHLELSDGIVVNLSRKDILYFAELYEEKQNENK